MAIRRVLVELSVPQADSASVLSVAISLERLGFALDASYEPIGVDPEGHTVFIRGEIDEGRVEELEAFPDVIKVWSDARIVPFSDGQEEPDKGPKFGF